MVIDVHYHPAFIKEVCGDEELAERRRNDMAYYKTGVAEVERIKERMKSSGVDRCFLLPHDYSTVSGDRISNEEMKNLVELGVGIPRNSSTRLGSARFILLYWRNPTFDIMISFTFRPF